MKKARPFILASLIALTLVVPTQAVQAQSDQPATNDTESITLSPSSRRYKLNAGQTTNESLTIINDGKTNYDFLVYSRPYSVNNEFYEPNFTKTTANADAYAWVQFPKAKYHLDAGQSVKIDYTIRVPAQAAPGGHYGVIFAETQPPSGPVQENAVIRKKRVGSLIYATVNGSVIEKGQATQATIPFWQLQPPLTAYSKVRNDGNTDFDNSTVFKVKDVFGNTKFEQTKDYTVLPGGVERRIPFEWPGSSWFGFYKVEISQTVLGKKTDSTGYVLMMPRYLPVLVIVFIVIGAIYAWIRHRKK